MVMPASESEREHAVRFVHLLPSTPLSCLSITSTTSDGLSVCLPPACSVDSDLICSLYSARRHFTSQTAPKSFNRNEHRAALLFESFDRQPIFSAPFTFAAQQLASNWKWLIYEWFLSDCLSSRWFSHSFCMTQVDAHKALLSQWENPLSVGSFAPYRFSVVVFSLPVFKLAF